MIGSESRTSRALWMLGSAVVGVAVSAPVELHFVHESAKADAALASFREWEELRPRAEIAARLITGELRRSSSRRRKIVPYALGMVSCTQIEGEQELFSILTYFEIQGVEIAHRRLDPSELSSYLGASPGRWLELLTILRDRSAGQPPLNPDRYEQLLHAITVTEILANVGSARIASLDWQPVRLLHERVSAIADGESEYVAIISNPNLVRSPVPCVCIEARSDDGQPVGRWLIYPSCAAIPPADEIEIRGRITWPPNGRPTAIRFVHHISEHRDVTALRGRLN